MIYDIHDNGGRPFRVAVTASYVTVSKLLEATTDEYQPILKYALNDRADAKDSDCDAIIDRIFVAKCESNRMTRRCQTYHDQNQGNSVLLQLANHLAPRYIYIGPRICEFETPYPIREYVSNLGPNDVPYSYARDTKGNYYLMGANVRIDFTDEFQHLFVYPYDEIFDFFYDYTLLNQNRCPNPISIRNFHVTTIVARDS